MRKECLFCRIAAGEIPVRVIEQNDVHMAFLTKYPNTPGCTVVIPKVHFPSYFADCDPAIIGGLISFASRVSKILDNAFDDVGRTALVFEGYGVDHLHAKLFPMHGTPKSDQPWKEIKSDINTWTNRYRGYVSSHDCDICSDADLDAVHQRILHSKSP